MHEGVQALVGLFLPLVGEVERAHRGCEWGVPQGALHKSGGHAGCEQMGGVGMPQGMASAPSCGQAGPVFGLTAGALDTGATHRGSRRRTLGVIAPGGGKEPGGVTRGFPGAAEPREGLGGPRDLPVLGALAAMDLDLEALPVNSGDLQGEGFMESEAQALDGGEGDLVRYGGSRLEDTPDFLHTEDRGEMGGGLRAQERQGGPVTLQDVLREEADAAGAEAHGRRGEAIDVFPVQEVTLQLLFGNAVGGCMGELGEQADFTNRRFLRPFTLAAELESRDHVLTQWGHE